MCCAHPAGGLIDACTQAASGVLTPAQAHAVLNQQLMYVGFILVVGGIASGLRAYLFNAAAERVMCRLRVQLFSKVKPCRAACCALLRCMLARCLGRHLHVTHLRVFTPCRAPDPLVYQLTSCSPVFACLSCLTLQLIVQECAFFDVTPVGELSNRLSEDTRAMKDAASTSISMALRYVNAAANNTLRCCTQLAYCLRRNNRPHTCSPQLCLTCRALGAVGLPAAVYCMVATTPAHPSV